MLEVSSDEVCILMVLTSGLMFFASFRIRFKIEDQGLKLGRNNFGFGNHVTTFSLEEVSRAL